MRAVRLADLNKRLDSADSSSTLSRPPFHTRYRQHYHPRQSQSLSCVLQPKCFNWSSYPLKKWQIMLVLLYTWGELVWNHLGSVWEEPKWVPGSQALLRLFSAVMEVGAPSSQPQDTVNVWNVGVLQKESENHGGRKKIKSLKIWLNKFRNCTLLEAGRVYSLGGSPYSWPALTFLFKHPSQPTVRDGIVSWPGFSCGQGWLVGGRWIHQLPMYQGALLGFRLLCSM